MPPVVVMNSSQAASGRHFGNGVIWERKNGHAPGPHGGGTRVARIRLALKAFNYGLESLNRSPVRFPPTPHVVDVMGATGLRLQGSEPPRAGPDPARLPRTNG